MDKQMIEEIAQDIACGCVDLVESSCGDLTPCYVCIARKLKDKNYRKIPENAVVLTREEWQQMKNSLYYSKEALEKKLQKARKKTAEKFAERLKEKIDNQEYLLLPTATVKYMIDEICKELTEGRE